MNALSPITEADIWSRIIQPDKGDLSEDAARALLLLKLSEMDRERVQELSAKANAGTLTQAEDQELERYSSVGRALEFLKAKARLSLNKRGC